MRININPARWNPIVVGFLTLAVLLLGSVCSFDAVAAGPQQTKTDKTESGFWKDLGRPQAATPKQDAALPSEQRPQPVAPLDEPKLTLAPSGLAANKAPEELLPAGAILHLRINGAGKLLDDASDMAMPFVPEKAVGPMAEIALEEPNPLLAMIGMQTMGQPMSVEMVAQLSGIDPKRPITASLYLAPPDQGFAVCIPVTDLNRFSASLGNAFPIIEPPQQIPLDGGTAQFVKSYDFKMFVVCSKDMVALCGSAEIAQAMLAGPDQEKLIQSKLISGATETYRDANIVLTVDTTPIKPLLPMLKQYQQIPAEAIAELRQKLLSELDDEAIENLNSQLRLRLGINDVEQLMDYAECLASGSYEVLFEQLIQLIDQFQGLTVAVNLGEEFQSVQFVVLSDSITLQSVTKPIPLAAVKQAIASLPGSKNFLTVSGKTPPPQKWEWLNSLIQRIGQKMAEKEMPMEMHAAIRDAYDAHTPVPTLASSVDWTIGTRFLQSGKWPHEHENLANYLAGIQHQKTGLIFLNAIPPHDAEFLAEHFAAKAKASNGNYMNWARLREGLGANASWLISSSHSAAEELENGVSRLTYEDRYKTRGGIFGYNEHELINRQFTLFRTTDQYSLLWPGGDDPEGFSAMTGEPAALAFENLLKHGNVPENVQQIEYLRFAHLLLDAVDFVGSLETLLHSDMEKYLAEVREKIANVDTEGKQAVMKKLEALEIPNHVARVNWNPDTREPYLVMPIGLTYPRPKIVPVAVELLKDYRQVSDSVGGALAFHATTNGRYKCTLVQSTAGISNLVRTVGNNVAEKYLRDRAAQQALEQKLYTELDGEFGSHEPLLINEFWSFLPW